MADQTSKVILTAEDKTAAAFRSASRNAQNLARETDRFTRSLTPAMRQATQAAEGLGLSLGKISTVVGAAEFTRRAIMGFAELEDKIARAGFSANMTEGQTKALWASLSKMSKEVNYSLDKLIGGFNSLQRKTDQTVEQSLAQLPKLAKVGKVVGIDAAQVADGFGVVQRKFKLNAAEADRVLEFMAAGVKGNGALLGEVIEQLPTLALNWSEVGGAGEESAKTMIASLLSAKRELGDTGKAAEGLSRMLNIIQDTGTSERFANLGITGNLQQRLELAAKEGGNPLIAFIKILKDLEKNVTKERFESLITSIFGPRQIGMVRAMLGFLDDKTGIAKSMGEIEDRAKSGVIERWLVALSGGTKEAIDDLIRAFTEFETEYAKLAQALGANVAIKTVTLLFGTMGAAADKATTAIEALKKAVGTKAGAEFGSSQLDSLIRGEGFDQLKEHFQKFQAEQHLPETRGTREQLSKNIGELGPGVPPGYRAMMEQRLLDLDDQIKKLIETIEAQGEKTGEPAAAEPPVPLPKPAPGRGSSELRDIETRTQKLIEERAASEARDDKLRADIAAREAETKALKENTQELRDLKKMRFLPGGGYGYGPEDGRPEPASFTPGGGTGSEPQWYGGGKFGMFAPGGGMPGPPGALPRFGPRGADADVGGGSTRGGPRIPGADPNAGRAANFLSSARAAEMGIQAGPGENLTTVATDAGKITVNKAAAADMAGFVNDLKAAGAPVGNIGSFANRRIAGSNKMSQHSYGGAMDLFNQTGRDEISKAGRQWLQQNPEKFRELLKQHNMVSGGDWKSSDLGHVEWGGPKYGEGLKDFAAGPAQPASAPTEAAGAITGRASTYNPRKPGWRSGGAQTASGEPYNPDDYTAAIQSGLRDKFGGVGYGKNYKPAYAMVEHGGKKVIVRINDVGPLTPGRVIDLNEKSMRHFDPGMTKGVLSGAKVTPLPGQNWTPGPVEETAARGGAAAPPEKPDTFGAGAQPVPYLRTSDGNDDAIDQHRQTREEMERPIKMKIDAPEMPSHFAPTFRRASARSSMNRALREQRWTSYSDIDGA